MPNRRGSLNSKVVVSIDGQDHGILLTVGFNGQKLSEVFSSSFKVGTSMNAIVSDACILLSRLYQHGDDPQEIAESLSQPHSLVGQIATWVANMEAE